MLKRSITYTNFNDEEITEEFYFNLSKAELIEMEVDKKEGLGEYLQKIIKAEDRKELIQMFKEIVLKAYGEKSEDGKRFIKNDEMREAFSQTAAYQELFMELATNDKAATIFIKAIMPKDMTEAVEKEALKNEMAGALTAVSETEVVPQNPPSA